MRAQIIYLTKNEVNGKSYVGYHSTVNIHDKYMGSGQLIKAALKKYNIKNFKKEILEELSNDSNWCEREIFWIKEKIRLFFTKKLIYGGLVFMTSVRNSKGVFRYSKHPFVLDIFVKAVKVLLLIRGHPVTYLRFSFAQNFQSHCSLIFV